MFKRALFVVATAACVLSVADAYAGPLDDLEMDVLAPGELPGAAMTRIMLPSRGMDHERPELGSPRAESRSGGAEFSAKSLTDRSIEISPVAGPDLPSRFEAPSQVTESVEMPEPPAPAEPPAAPEPVETIEITPEG